MGDKSRGPASGTVPPLADEDARLTGAATRSGVARSDGAGLRDPFDRTALARNRERALRAALNRPDGSGDPDFLLRLAMDDLLERLHGVERRFERAAIIDPPLGHLVGELSAHERVGDAVAVELETDGRLPLAPGSVDLVVSLMALHVTADVPGLLAQAARALRGDGLFLAAFPGGATLGELREVLLEAELELTGGASPRVFPFIDVREAGALLQRAGLALPVADIDRLTVRYADALALMRDLRAMGMGNALADRSRRSMPRAVLFRAASLYAERHSDPDGRVRATHEIVSLSGWRPHESQQRPLSPGSGRVRLGEVLPDRTPGAR